jgi:hypothetical protein
VNWRAASVFERAIRNFGPFTETTVLLFIVLAEPVEGA